MRSILSCVLVLGLFVCLSSDLVAAAPSIEQVRKELAGKSMAEVKNTLGAPDDVSVTAGFSSWHYNFKTSDPDSGKEFKSITIWFTIRKIVDSVDPSDIEW